MQEFPTLDGQAEFLQQKKANEEKQSFEKKQEEEKQNEEPTLSNIQGGGKRKRKGGKGPGQVE